MKTFKQHLSEHSAKAFKKQWMDQDTMPSAPNALEALNSFLCQMSEQEYLNPQVGIEQLQTQLGKLGYHFEAPTLSGEGEYSVPLSYGAGGVGAEYDENSYGEFKEDDGISNHIEGGVSLVITVDPTGYGKSLMSAQLKRNME